MRKAQSLAVIQNGLIAGAAGGLAEVAWVTAYSWVTGGNPEVLAQGVSTASGIDALLPGSYAALGVGVHMVLALTLGVALAFTWRVLSVRQGGSVNPYPFMLAALTCVWAVNFFVLLPIVSPGFVHLLSYPVSLTSKLLFALAAAEVVRRQTALMPNVHSTATILVR